MNIKEKAAFVLFQFIPIYSLVNIKPGLGSGILKDFLKCLYLKEQIPLLNTTIPHFSKEIIVFNCIEVHSGFFSRLLKHNKQYYFMAILIIYVS